MTDRELLEFAAKAAGIAGFWVDVGLNTGSDASPMIWDPRNDDGDCARMEAALGIHVTWHSDGVVCGKRIWQETAMFEDHNGDRQAARRIASLRIAAAIGKAMP